MRLIERLHGWHHHNRRLRVLSRRMAALIPEDARVLDVGCGDGLLTRRIGDCRRDIEVSGVDVMVRANTHVPVQAFDGQEIPHADGSFDAVMLVDVVHHAEDPVVLLREAARVARSSVLLKDHTLRGNLAGPVLAFMDRTSNHRHGVHSPCNYFTPAQWRAAISELPLAVDVWDTDLALYPWGSRWLFERSLHFVARLNVASAPARPTSRR